jgi:photosystem II stability/assembly factor-like uncharacterized protein
LKNWISVKLRLTVASLFFRAFLATPMHAVTWFPLGPYGGDARSFAADTHDSQHLYLGTANGWVYDTRDGGINWVRLSQLDKRNDLVLDNILTDPQHPQRLIVGAHTVDRPDGGFFISEDGGHTWIDVPQMHGQSIRSLARSQSDPQVIVAGTLQGVFRSTDNGLHWSQISPVGSTEIHEIESLAIDPKNPQTIYAGTWHLPWKTTDGGAHWVNIKKGIIEDSDVFSILVDPKQTQIVYASACSGIYKSTDAAAEFKKVQGIPSAARRTRKLEQDPEHLDTVYAGTTEGLYRTLDAGQHWDRMTSSDVIINDVYVDPKDSGHVLLATDRGGVLRSDDFAASFHSSNTGFSAQQIVAYAADPHNQALLSVGVVNDKEAGGVFQSQDGGITWHQQSVGLGGRDVYSLTTAPDGALLAGTTHGIFRLQDGLWGNTGNLLQASTHRSSKEHPVRASAHSYQQVDSVVYAMVPDDDFIYAGTSEGLLRSATAGTSWSPIATLQMTDTRFVAVQGKTLLVAGLKRIELSQDSGATWSTLALPPLLTQVSSLALDDQKNLWVGGREGVFVSSDRGHTWQQIHNLEIHQVDAIFFDAPNHRMLLTTSESPMIFSVTLPDHHVSYWDTGWKLRFARPVGDHLLGVTLYDGVVIQPKMVDSGFAPTHSNTGN